MKVQRNQQVVPTPPRHVRREKRDYLQMKHNGPEIARRNVEWFERVCPPKITARAAENSQYVNPGFFGLLHKDAVQRDYAHGYVLWDKNVSFREQMKIKFLRKEIHDNRFVYDITLDQYKELKP